MGARNADWVDNFQHKRILSEKRHEAMGRGGDGDIPSTGKSSNSSSSSRAAADFCAVWGCSGFSELVV